MDTYTEISKIQEYRIPLTKNNIEYIEKTAGT